MKKLEFEMRKFERKAELELARMEREKKKEKRKRGREDREKRMEGEEREKEKEREEREKREERVAEEKNRQLEHEFRMKELEMRGVASQRGESGMTGERTVERGDSPRWEKTLAGRTKRYGETLRHVLPKMPTDVGEIPPIH